MAFPALPAAAADVNPTAETAKKKKKKKKKKKSGGGGESTPAAPSPGGTGSSPPPDPPPEPSTGRVTYTARDCFRTVSGAPPTPRAAPLDGALVRLVPDTGDVLQARTDANGRFNANVTAGKTYQLTAILDSPKVSLGPDASPSPPYEIQLGQLTQPNQTYTIGQGAGDLTLDGPEGAANIFSVLQKGARVGVAASDPIDLPKVHGLWRYMANLNSWIPAGHPGSRYDPARGSFYDPADKTIVIGGNEDGSQRAEYHSFTLLHEYGHHVLQTVAPQPDGPDETHGLTTTHQSAPGLPWAEGFSHAFAAIASGSPVQTLNCVPRLDLDPEQDDFSSPWNPARANLNPEDPLTPMPPAPREHLGQYNESAIAGGLWSLADHFGGATVDENYVETPGDKQVGLKRMLGSFHDAPPNSMRDAQDALAEDTSITDADLTQVNSRLFEHRIGWGVSMSIYPGEENTANMSVNETQIKMTGAYGCQLASESQVINDQMERSGFGGLGHTGHDDCLGLTDGSPYWNPPFDAFYYNAYSHHDALSLSLPYSGTSLPASDDLTLSARYTCTSRVADDRCADSITPEFIVGHGVRSFEADVVLPQGTWVPILEIDGQGNCLAYVDGPIACDV